MFRDGKYSVNWMGGMFSELDGGACLVNWMGVYELEGCMFSELDGGICLVNWRGGMFSELEGGHV